MSEEQPIKRGKGRPRRYPKIETLADEVKVVPKPRKEPKPIVEKKPIIEVMEEVEEPVVIEKTTLKKGRMSDKETEESMVVYRGDPTMVAPTEMDLIRKISLKDALKPSECGLKQYDRTMRILNELNLEADELVSLCSDLYFVKGKTQTQILNYLKKTIKLDNEAGSYILNMTIMKQVSDTQVNSMYLQNLNSAIHRKQRLTNRLELIEDDEESCNDDILPLYEELRKIEEVITKCLDTLQKQQIAQHALSNDTTRVEIEKDKAYANTTTIELLNTLEGTNYDTE